MLKGKGVWIYQLSRTEGADPWAITSKAAHAGLSHVAVRVSVGARPENSAVLLSRLVKALHSQGIECWAWAYLYGPGYYDKSRRWHDYSLDHARAEGELLAQRAVAMGADGLIMDCEGEYEHPGRKAHPAAGEDPSAAAPWAAASCEAVRALWKGPLALSSFWKPSYHANVPWHTFAAKCDLFMPQVYWHSDDPKDTKLGNPVKMLRTSVSEFAPYLTPYGRPLFPTGVIARVEAQDPGLVAKFCSEVNALGLCGANFWDWHESTAGTWKAMATWTPTGAGG